MTNRIVSIIFKVCDWGFGFLKTTFGCTNTNDQLSKQSTHKLLSKHQKYPDTPKPPACGADGYNLGS